ncbi:hypothetical protein J6590_007094 [Homalodisca vitripennis]|nr:hypothetical protein J6590_007094 [Homalodisca vitripennis]
MVANKQELLWQCPAHAHCTAESCAWHVTTGRGLVKESITKPNLDRLWKNGRIEDIGAGPADRTQIRYPVNLTLRIPGREPR